MCNSKNKTTNSELLVSISRQLRCWILLYSKWKQCKQTSIICPWRNLPGYALNFTGGQGLFIKSLNAQGWNGIGNIAVFTSFIVMKYNSAGLNPKFWSRFRIQFWNRILRFFDKKTFFLIQSLNILYLVSFKCTFSYLSIFLVVNDYFHNKENKVWNLYIIRERSHVSEVT